jgi:hypothetical protein
MDLAALHLSCNSAEGIESKTERNFDRYSAEQVLDAQEAYYKVRHYPYYSHLF